MAVAIDTALLSSVDFSGLIRVETTRDNDFVEFVFSFQDSSNFYAVYSSKSGTNQGPGLGRYYALNQQILKVSYQITIPMEINLFMKEVFELQFLSLE